MAGDYPCVRPPRAPKILTFEGVIAFENDTVGAIDRNTGGLGVGKQGIDCRRQQQLGQLGSSIISRGIRLGQ